MFTNNLNKALRYKAIIALFLIVIFASVVRIYKISEAPPSLTWDEVAVGYNAWTIGNYGKDETGKVLPLVFRSFLDDKHPVHVYFTAFFVKTLGLSEFSIRVGSTLFGILNVIVIFYLTKLLFKNVNIALLSSAILAIAPYAIHFSRFNHELNFALFFTYLGIYLFLKGLEKKNILLFLAFFSFTVAFVTYHSSKIIVPAILATLFLLFYRELKRVIALLVLSSIWVLVLGFIVWTNPALLGGARAKQVAFSEQTIKQTYLFKETGNQTLGWINVIAANYLSHFNLQYLFKTGDKNPRLSSQVSGEFYIIEAPFLLIGGIALLLLKTKQALLILLIALLAPLPASLGSEVPHASRAMFMVGSWHIIIGYGIYKLLRLIKLQPFIISSLIVLILAYAWNFKEYYTHYFSEFSQRYAIDWQYGMREVVEYVRAHPEYTRVYMTNIRSQPYIFFLLYTQKPLDEFLKEVEYNTSSTRSFNLVASFDRYQFEYWDPIESTPKPDKLYILTSDQYDGLKYKSSFKVKKIVYYPNQTTAFYLVSVN